MEASWSVGWWVLGVETRSDGNLGTDESLQVCLSNLRWKEDGVDDDDGQDEMVLVLVFGTMRRSCMYEV